MPPTSPYLWLAILPVLLLLAVRRVPRPWGELGAISLWLAAVGMLWTPLPIETAPAPVSDLAVSPGVDPTEELMAAAANLTEEAVEHAIELPYEGSGRRLSIPVVFRHGNKEVETFMMLDTGTTYTTLPRSVIDMLGIAIPKDAPVLTMNTANGQRQARALLVDSVWLGDIEISGVAVTECEDCSSGEDVGLLGLNVTGMFNMAIDADHRVVEFTVREQVSRHLDLKLFTKMGMRVRGRGQHATATISLTNESQRPIQRGTVEVTCGDFSTRFDIEGADPGMTSHTSMRLPPHQCPGRYQYRLVDGWW